MLDELKKKIMEGDYDRVFIMLGIDEEKARKITTKIKNSFVEDIAYARAMENPFHKVDVHEILKENIKDIETIEELIWVFYTLGYMSAIIELGNYVVPLFMYYYSDLLEDIKKKADELKREFFKDVF